MRVTTPIDAAPDSPAPLRGQRAFVTVLFCDVCGSSAHAERQEAEEYAEWLGQFRRLARAIVAAHGGLIARLQGDGMLALFGALDPHEDDGRRATDAALALHAAVARLRDDGAGQDGDTLRLHSGIHAGLVLLLEGDIELGRFDVVGEVPNTAARLCAMAAPGEILVSAETLGPHAPMFQAAARKTVPVRGRSAGIDVLHVAGRTPLDRRFDAAARRGAVPFVGRDAALADLDEAVQALRSGQPRSIVVLGEPGIGKTRLLREFVAGVGDVGGDGLCVLQGSCESYLSAQPLQPLLEALQLADSAGSAAAADGDTPRRALNAPAVVQAVRDRAAGRPLLLVLDDWQWADDASRQALDGIARELTALIVIGARAGAELDGALAEAQRLTLPPLATTEADRVVQAWLPGVEPFLLQDILERSGGNPLFLEELCHAAASDENFSALSKVHGIAWLNALVASRVKRLPAPSMRALQAAAVAGQRFPGWVLDALLGPAQARSEAAELAALGFLVGADDDDGNLHFKHALTREAVYSTVALDERRRLHAAVAHSLERASDASGGNEWVEALAHHWVAAADWRNALPCAEAAGDKALAAAALDRARGHYMAALQALDKLGLHEREAKLRWCAIAQRLGQTCVFDPLNTAHDLGLFERASQLAREAGDENALARAEYWLAYVNYGKGRPRRAVRHSEVALNHAERSGDPRLVAQVTATLGQSLASAGQYERALALLRDAVSSKQRQSRPGSGAAIGSAYSFARMAYSLGDLGRFDEAEACFAQSLALLGDRLHPVWASVHELICAVHLWQGRWAEAADAGARGADFALRCASHYLMAMGRALSACGTWADSSDAAALQSLRDATAWIEARGAAVSTSLNHGWLVEAAVRQGDAVAARRHAGRLLQRARLHDRQGLTMGLRALARLAAAQGDAAR